jgi:hypothetical protein
MAGVVNIRAALETALNGMSPSIATSFENAAFILPIYPAPYQIVNILFARPDNREYGARHEELGYMQVKLMYRLQVGTADVAARAELLRSTFKRGNTFTSGGITVMVTETPSIGAGIVEGDRYAVAVKIPFHSNIG